jgi:hypothetical protein
MQSHVRSVVRQQKQIFQAVVSLPLVQVVNNLKASQIPRKVPLHHKAVLHHVARSAGSRVRWAVLKHVALMEHRLT